MSDKSRRIIKRILLLGSVFAAIKLIFVDYTLDEEYQIVMAYRNLIGDDLFKQMWEPHQTSAFLCSGLMWLYCTVTGTTTGVLLFLRVVALAVQVLLSLWMYRVISTVIDREYAYILALLYFNIVPKNIQIPEFSNMQLWFLTIAVLLLMKYLGMEKQQRRKHFYLLIGVGISLSCEILTYPTCILLFPLFLFFILRKAERDKWRGCCILTGTCAVCGGLWLTWVLSHVSVQELIRNAQSMLSFDVSHDVSGVTSAKVFNYLYNFKLWGIMLAGVALCAGFLTIMVSLWKMKRSKVRLEKRELWLRFWMFAIAIAEGIQLYYWVIEDCGYEYLQIHLLVIWLAAAFLWKYAGKEKGFLQVGIWATLVAYAGVMYISDLAMYYTLPHGALGIVFSCVAIILALQAVWKERATVWIYFLIVSFCLCSMIGKGYTLRGGKALNSVFAVGGVMKDGPAAGILAEYMCAYIYNSNFEDYGEYIRPGDRVLIVANTVMSVGTTAYLFEDVDIYHYSIVDPTAYDERLLAYWEQFPEKQPNVIVVDCWYGELKEDPNHWIMQYIESDFGYTSVQDGRYVRFYRRE